jgi:hypothetical protein
MNFLTWIKDIFLGSFTSLAERIAAVRQDAIDGGLSPDWGKVIFLCVVIFIWFGSAFFSGSVAEAKGRNRLLHFFGGLIVPWAYPFFILFFLTLPAHKNKEEELKNPDAPETEQKDKKDLLSEGAIPESHFQEEEENESQKEDKITPDYLKQIATDEFGNNNGPFILTFDDGMVIEISRIAEIFPDVVVVELIVASRTKTIRFPYAKIKSCVKQPCDSAGKIPVKEEPSVVKLSEQVEKKDGLIIKPWFAEHLKEMAKKGKDISHNIEETARLSAEALSRPIHLGSYVILKPGTIIGGCKIIAEIGKGGVGIVYHAHHSRLDIPVALKVISAKHKPEDNISLSVGFLQEAKIAAKIRHRCVVAVMDAGKDEENELFYIIMEHMGGGTVGEMLRKEGHFSQGDALNIVVAVAEALAAGQKLNIVHRDIKPDNIMLTSDGEIKLSDLGLAKIIDPQNVESPAPSNMIMGSAPYISPEQARDFSGVDFRSDVYSLGATFFHLLTGEFPFKAKNPLEAIMKNMHDPVPDPRVLLKDIDGEIADICMKMMAKKPENRYQTPSELLEIFYKTSERISSTI